MASIIMMPAMRHLMYATAQVSLLRRFCFLTRLNGTLQVRVSKLHAENSAKARGKGTPIIKLVPPQHRGCRDACSPSTY